VNSVPLRRNRDFVLLLSGRLLSTVGSQVTAIAYPLLVLAVTHSPAKAGIVGFAGLVPHAVFGLPAGVAADRWNRKRLMIAADGLRALAIASLATTILLDRVSFWQVAVVAFVEGTGSVFFNTAHAGALRAVVPRQQLPAAVGVIRARSATVMLAGPPLGGALFALGRAVPFLFDAVSYGFSFLSLVLMRTPFQEEREVDTARLRSQIVEGFRFLWGQPFLRTCAFLYGLGNFTIPGILLVLIVAGQRHGLSSAGIGALLAAFGAATLVGSLASPLFRRKLSVRGILLLELRAGLGITAFLVWPSVYVLTAAMVVQGVTLPVTDSVVDGYRIAVTPDRLLGRVESARSTIALLAAPLGPLVAGLLLASTSARATVAFFAVFTLVLALWGTLSPAIRKAPSLDELDALPTSTAS
jgi:MFS family permease